MKNKYNRGFTLIELLGVLLILAAIFIFSIPIVMGIINYSKKSAFKSSALSVFDSVAYYVANNKFTSISDSGIDITNTSGLNLKNNNFNSGLIIKNNNDKFELLYLTEGDFCAKGTEENIKISDKGCGILDNTEPNNVSLYLIDSTNTSIKILASGYDDDSDIIKYEFSIDGKKYVTNKNAKDSTYNFNNISLGEHSFKVRITNEAGLTKDSDEYKFSTINNELIDCNLNTGKIIGNKEATCSYSLDSSYTYQYSFNDFNYQDIKLNDDKYTFKINEKGTLYTRILKDNVVISLTSINFNNIDNTLNGANPVLTDNMIPIVYDETLKSWVKADSKTIYWDYEDKIWANAVVVREYEDSNDDNSKSRNYYLSDEAIGKPIYENDILAYYVWIPRFAYKIWNVNGTDYNSKENNGEHLIDIVFQSSNDKSSGISNGLISNDNYYTHPAFTVDDKELNGIWVSKFQTSVKDYTECYKNPNVINCNKSTNLDIYSLPDIKPIKYISISSAYLLSKNMNSSLNIYGFDSNINTHLIKNTEWGAVAYLSHSIYGSDITTNEKEETGYNYKVNTNTSTTGNVYGIYDTGSIYYEMVMGNYNNDPGNDYDNQSGFVGLNGSVEWPNSIYYDLYNGITSKSRILGDATGEIEGWFNTSNNFINGTNPFFIRGGNSSKINSIFSYSNYSGKTEDLVTFRFVVTK